RTEIWMAAQLDRSPRGGSHNQRTIARLKPGVTMEQAQTEISVIARNQERLYPDTNAGWEITATPFRDYLFVGANVALPLLLGAVGCLLVLACANIANMQLSRAIRSSGNPDSLAHAVRRELQAIDPGQAVFNVRPLENFLSDSTAQRRFNTLL